MTSTRSTTPAPAPPDVSAGFPVVDAAVDRARAAFVPDVDLATRLDRLHRLEDLVRENRTVLEEALAADLGKPPAEAVLAGTPLVNEERRVTIPEGTLWIEGNDGASISRQLAEHGLL